MNLESLSPRQGKHPITSYYANKAQQVKKGNVDINDANANMPNYFRSCINRAADKKSTEALANKIHNEFSHVSL